MKNTANNLPQIETEIQQLLTKEKKSWKKIGELMLIVKNQELYKGEFKSFTKWVGHVSYSTNVATSYIWRIFKASRTFLGLIASDKPEDLHQATSTPYQLETFAQIEKYAPKDIVEVQMEKILSGDAKTKELRETWNAVKLNQLERFNETEFNNSQFNEVNNVTLADTQLNTLTADEVYEVVTLKTEWVRTLCLQHYPFIAKMSTPTETKSFKEVTVRIDTEEKTRFGKPKPQRRRFDAIMTIKPHYAAYGEELMTAGIEIKVSKHDLLNDDKFEEYIGWTDFFFFAVPHKLVESAMEKAESSEHSDLIGVLDVEKGEMVKVPVRQEVGVREKMEVYREIVFK
ncbi:hypothetical protein [Flammeovirga aprica]|uniref:Uncharacterized protein n=1 Tax=Flammeovirga aprica JL-4 TaxID=694437 RepID=A0A7X9XDM5_9BACT|nr:hypothetical protein [Flammeovirga aprica]NME72809.1 hypothetical protein [Flammeovirga aprica JL-4]